VVHLQAGGKVVAASLHATLERRAGKIVGASDQHDTSRSMQRVTGFVPRSAGVVCIGFNSG